MKTLKNLASTFLASLYVSGISIQPSQAADTMAISLIQPDGSKRAMKLDLDQPLSAVRVMLVGKGLDITTNDQFSSMEMGVLSPREEAQWKVREFLSGNVLSFRLRASGVGKPSEVNAPDPLYNFVDKVYASGVAYSSGGFQCYREGATCSTQPRNPQKPRTQAVLSYDDAPIPERVLKKVVPGKDGRVRIQDTTEWPHSIHAHLGMKIHGDTYMGSGVMVGPHHLLTCAHCVYKFDEGAFFEQISVYPALNDATAPFNKVKATRAYMFKAYQDQGDARFDMALLLLNQSIGDYTGWGGLLSTADGDLFQETVSITGYPGDKGGGKQMWSMSHKIKTVKPEAFDYEIDTYGGQSGSPIWINKWGMPLILGVHTLGSNDINSGVRLSASKFEKIVEIIRDTYVLNSDVDGLNLGSLALQPDAALRPLISTPVPVISIPPVARGNEAIYERFLKGVLLYRPTKGSDVGMVTLPIADLPNPLEGTFDLSRCGDTGKYLSIATGYRKGKKPENAGKVEIWFVPRFLIEKERSTTAKHFEPIYDNWKEQAEVGMFWTGGGSAADDHNMDYLVTENMGNLSKINLFKNWEKAGGAGATIMRWLGGRVSSVRVGFIQSSISHFHVSFIN